MKYFIFLLSLLLYSCSNNKKNNQAIDSNKDSIQEIDLDKMVYLEKNRIKIDSNKIADFKTTKIKDLYTQNLAHKFSGSSNAYIFSGGYPFGRTLQPKNIYVAKIDSNENIIYEFRTVKANSNHSFEYDSLKKKNFIYYLNILKNEKYRSYYFGEYLIDSTTLIRDIDDIYLKYKNQKTSLCCETEGKDWEYTGSHDLRIDSCQNI